jgi:hypothetical protein
MKWPARPPDVDIGGILRTDPRAEHSADRVHLQYDLDCLDVDAAAFAQAEAEIAAERAKRAAVVDDADDGFITDFLEDMARLADERGHLDPPVSPSSPPVSPADPPVCAPEDE